ncbi:hypothetical protein ACWNXI_07405 [Caldibacillus thermoamylovorans]
MSKFVVKETDLRSMLIHHRVSQTKNVLPLVSRFMPSDAGQGPSLFFTTLLNREQHFLMNVFGEIPPTGW